MADINIRSDSVDVEQIMEQIRGRIREKRDVDYTEEQIQELAAVKLEKFLDPRGVRSDLLEQFRRARPSPPERPNYAFEAQTLYETHRAPLRWLRGLLRPILKLFFNPDPLVQALHIQSRLNDREARLEGTRHELDQLNYEVLHNLVVEVTRIGIEIKNVKMRVESLTSRLEFNERRARALEGVVLYKPSAEDVETVAVEHESAEQAAGSESSPTGPRAEGEGPGQRSRRRRRRRGRRGGASAVSVMAGDNVAAGPDSTAPSSAPDMIASTVPQQASAEESDATNKPSEPARTPVESTSTASSPADGRAPEPGAESAEHTKTDHERDPD